MTNIAIDIDGVLADFTEGFGRLVNSIYPGTIPPGYEPSDWNWSDVLTPEMERSSWDRLGRTTNFWKTLSPFTENIKALEGFLSRTLHEKEVNIYYVTARVDSAGETTLSQTTQWLAELGDYGLLQDNTSVIVADEKPPIYQGIGVRYSIDDRYKNVMDCLAVPYHRPFLLDRKWNRVTPTPFADRVPDLETFLTKVEALL